MGRWRRACTATATRSMTPPQPYLPRPTAAPAGSDHGAGLPPGPPLQEPRGGRSGPNSAAPPRTAPGPPPGLPAGRSEGGESEQRTDDPTVDPDEFHLQGRRARRRRRRPADEPQQVPSGPDQGPPGAPQGQPSGKGLPKGQSVGRGPQQAAETWASLSALRQLVNERPTTAASTDSWNSRRGPERGVRWRGGTPPSPPTWKYTSTDLRAFSRWERRVCTWELQVQNHMTKAEAALALFTSLTGEAEQETEHLDLSLVNDKNGIEYVLGALRDPLQQREIYQKRKLLADFENVCRSQSESVRQYINRSRRIERDLESVGVSPAQMYDDEAKGNRLLERCRLPPDLARLTLVASVK